MSTTSISNFLNSLYKTGTRSGKAIACRLPAPNDDYIQMMRSSLSAAGTAAFRLVVFHVSPRSNHFYVNGTTDGRIHKTYTYTHTLAATQ